MTYSNISIIIRKLGNIDKAYFQILPTAHLSSTKIYCEEKKKAGCHTHKKKHIVLNALIVAFDHNIKENALPKFKMHLGSFRRNTCHKLSRNIKIMFLDSDLV